MNHPPKSYWRWDFPLFRYDYLYIFGTHEALHHLASFPPSEEMISQLRIEPPTTLFGFGTSPLPSGSLESAWAHLVTFIKRACVLIH